jgi:hypothetical protein
VAAKVREWAAHHETLAQRGRDARILYDRVFPAARIRGQLSDSLTFLQTDMDSIL